MPRGTTILPCRHRRRLSPPLRSALLGLLTSSLLAPCAQAQIGQYSAPGNLLNSPTPTRDVLETAVADARWRLGGLRVDPSLSLSNLSYLSDVFSGSGGPEESDLTASVRAGIRAYLPFGPKVTLAGYVLPEYNWWQNLEDRRSVTGRYGVGLYGYYNRMTLEITGDATENQGFVSPEIEQKTESRQNTARVSVEIEATRAVTLFAEASTSSSEFTRFNEPGSTDFSVLDRNQDTLRGGVRLGLGEHLDLGFGVERAELEFDDTANNLSSSGTSALVQLRYSQGRVGFDAEVVQRSLEPTGDSVLASVDETTGRIQASIQARSRLSLKIYAIRDLLFSISSDYSSFLDQRFGAGFSWELGRRWTARGFVEEGENDYVESGPGVAARLDDTRAIGGRLSFQARPKIVVEIGLSRREFDSNLPGADRDLTQATSTISLGQRAWP